MSRNSQARDAYEAKMAGKDDVDTLKMLLDSPYRRHQLRGRRLLAIAQTIDKMRGDGKEQEVRDALQL